MVELLSSRQDLRRGRRNRKTRYRKPRFQNRRRKDGWLAPSIRQKIETIESGIPVVGFLYPIKHAISIIGHGEIDYQMLNDNHIVEQQNDMGINAISHSVLIRDLYVMDDNGFPYCKVPIGLPSKEKDVTYGAGELKYVVVPLYRKMQLSYNEVFEKFCVWRKEGVMNWEELCIYRIYITSSNSLKEKALASENMNDDLRDTILNMTYYYRYNCINSRRQCMAIET